MVMHIQGLTGNAVRDWWIQRVSAVVIATYVITLTVFFLMHREVSFVEWRAFMFHPLMRVLNLLALLSLVVHAWIGIWRVTSDYLTCRVLRLSIQAAIALFLIGLLIWGFEIFWSIQ